MSYRLILRPEAELDITEAYEWYEERNQGLGSEFVRAVDACLSAIGRNPQAYAVVHEEVRRALLRRFPYGIFYLVEGESIIVLACFHAKRKPKDWQSRNS